MGTDFEVDLVLIIICYDIDCFSPTDVLDFQVPVENLSVNEGLVKIEDKCDFIFGYLWEFKNFMGLGREIRALEEFEGIDFFHKMC